MKEYNKKSKIIDYKKKTNIVTQKRVLILVICTSIIFLALLIRLFYLQTVQASWLNEEASRQQVAVRTISSKRGIIYDSTGKVLAASAAVDTVSVSPSYIKKDNKEKVAKALSDIFELDYEETLAKVNSERSNETIIKKVEQDKITLLKNWMEENDYYSGINIDEDVKRYYPFNNLASSLIGFCDTDNNGQEGLELKWNSVLSGTPGKITTIKNVNSDLVPDKDQTYTPAENGSNITLTIDANIQTIVEKYLKQACIENETAYGGTAIVMAPSTGDILAMAIYPDYDLNNPRTPNESLAEGWDELSETEQLNSLYKMWRNKAVADTYEPGSTFKIITASIGLEEGIVTTDTPKDFLCSGYELVNGIQINCWRSYTTHGHQTLRQGLMNSCNPAFMQLGAKIGAPTLYKYYEAFGLFDKTGISTSYEANSNFWDLETVGNVETATMSFGQRFTITPIQLITAVSSIANDGVLMEPRIVKQIENSDTGSITTLEPTKVRQVLSKDTCDKVLSMLESVVADGTGYRGEVEGYSIAGKTGTSEPNNSSETPMYVASFIAIAPTENPEVVTLVALFGPEGPEGHQGGTIAAPVVSQILTEVLPYLGIPSNVSDVSTSNSNSTIVLTDVRNKTVAEAKKVLENQGFTCIVSGNDSSLLVTDQVPKPGTSLIKGSTINLYSEGNEARISTEVPNLKGMSLAQAKNALRAKNLNIHATGSSGKIVSQDPMAGTSVEQGTVINVTLQDTSTEAH